jgi:glycine/D-amino acid oxidase-like deaminating enzyme
MPVDVVIIGGGIFGQVIGTALEAQGRQVVIIDDSRKDAASATSAGLMRQRRFYGFDKVIYNQSRKLLDELYDIKPITFKVQKTVSMKMDFIAPSSILGRVKVTPGFVVGVNAQTITYKDLIDGEIKKVAGDLVIVAAGIWTEVLLPVYQQIPQKGVAFLYPTEIIAKPFIHPSLFGRNTVGFNRGDGAWVSDGTLVHRDKWSVHHERKALKRCQNSSWITLEPTMLTGIRPYSPSAKVCILEQVQRGMWVATGGAKNGLLAAGHCARILRERTT